MLRACEGHAAHVHRVTCFCRDATEEYLECLCRVLNCAPNLNNFAFEFVYQNNEEDDDDESVPLNVRLFVTCAA